MLSQSRIPHVLWNMKDHRHVPSSPPTLPVMNQMTQGHTLPTYFIMLNSIIILPSMTRSPMWSPSFRFPQQIPITCQFPPTQVRSLDHLTLLDSITLATSVKKCKSYGSSICNFLQPPVTSSLLGSIIFLNTIFLNNLRLRSSLMDRYQLLQNQEHCMHRQCSMSKKITLFYKVNIQYNLHESHR